MIRARSVWMVGVFAVVLISTARSADEAGAAFTSKAGGFSASFPDKPKVEERKPGNKAIVMDTRVEAKRDGVSYSVGWIAYAKEIAERLNALDPAEFAKKQRAATVKRTTGMVLSEKDVTLGKAKRPGYELLIQTGPRQFLRQRACYANGRLYQLLIAGTTREAVPGTAAERFIDSFRIND